MMLTSRLVPLTTAAGAASLVAYQQCAPDTAWEPMSCERVCMFCSEEKSMMHFTASVLCNCLHYVGPDSLLVSAAALSREVWHGVFGEGKAGADLAALVCGPNGARRACG